MRNINVRIAELAPSKNIHANMPIQFTWRKTGEFIGSSEIVIADIKEPIWWNRPLESDILCKLEDDGIYSYNMPYIGNTPWKSGYNLLLGKNSVPVAIHIKLPNNIQQPQERLLENMNYVVIQDTLIELGVDPTRVKLANNDLLYDGKKFMGLEYAIKGGVYSCNIVITMAYKPEAEIFERLTGKYAKNRGITGIAEETGLFTKGMFMSSLKKNYINYIEKI